jgi:lipopolysaccharide transport system permease protein
LNPGEGAAGEASAGRTAAAQAAWRDLVEGGRLWRLVCALGWMDIRLRYRGSVLGPLWLTLSTAVMVAALGGLYAGLFRLSAADYVPYLAVSLVLWNSLAAQVADSCTVFVQQESTIRSMRMPFCVHAARVLMRNVLALTHNALVLVPVFLLFGVFPGMKALLMLPALALWVVDGFLLALALGAVCARFRDISPVAASAVQLAFFITPVIWKPELIGVRAVLLPLNPFHALLEIVRAPLLGEPAGIAVWTSAVAYSLVLAAVSWAVFIRARPRLAYWV